MSRARYNQAGRTLTVVSVLGLIMATMFAWAIILERDWQYLPIVITVWAVNIIIFTIVVADGAKRFGDRENGE